MDNKNRHIGSSLDSLLEEDGLRDDVTATAIKRTLALQIEQEMSAQNISKSEMSRRMNCRSSDVI